MERYSKTSSSKWQSKYSEEFKRFVCNDFLTGTLTKREIENKYNIGHTRLTYWLKEIGFDYSKPSIVSLPRMKEQTNKLSGNEDQESLSQLKRELQEARLLAEAYRKMIEIAEQEFKIKIVKKSNTK
jgi:transposase-like protein